MADRPHSYPRTDDGAYIPTVAEIEAAAAEIRATWSDNDYRKRLGLLVDDSVEVTIVRDRELWADQNGRHRAEGA
jgi:hypothetical protein